MIEKKKSFLNSLKSQTKPVIAIEKQLLPRLKFMGYVLLFCSFCTIIYAVLEDSGLLLSEEYPIQGRSESIASFTYPGEDDPLEVHLFNSYIVALSFIATSAACFLYVRKKKKWLDMQPASVPEEKPEENKPQE